MADAVQRLDEVLTTIDFHSPRVNATPNARLRYKQNMANVARYGLSVIVLLAGGGWTTVAIAQTAPASASDPSATLETFVDGVVEAHRRLRGIPGVSVSVVKDGQLRFAKGYGLADLATKRSIQGDRTLFRIGSVSKTFVWTAVMMLYEQGRIDLAVDVNRYLKRVKVPRAFGAPVTMNDLMAHRAGFEDTLAVFTHSDTEDLSLTDALIRDMPNRALAPGTRTAYSNYGSALAAQIVADVSGVPYERFLAERILEPLGMDRTTMKGPALMPEPLRRDLAVGYLLRGGLPEEAEFMNIGPYAPIGAMASTAKDMASWMLLHLGRGARGRARLMKARTHRLMWMRAFSDRSAATDMAHGFMNRTYRGYECFGHGGATGEFLSYMELVPNLQLGVYVSQNALPDRSLVTDLTDLIIDHLTGGEPETTAPTRDPPPDASYADYAGTYISNRRPFTSFLKLASMSAVITISLDQHGHLLLSAGAQVRRLRPVVGAIDTFEDDVGARVFFGRDGGSVSYVSDGSGATTYERAGVVNDPKILLAILGATFFAAITILLAAWKRHGRRRETKATGSFLDVYDVAAALAVVVFCVALVAMVVALSSVTASVMLEYPPPIVRGVRWTAWAVFVFAGGAVITAVHAWAAAGWTFWRKLHHSVFAFLLSLLALLLINWNIIFSPLI